MEKMKVHSQAAYDWVEELPPNTWVKAFFSDFPKCDMLLNNHSEVFNSYIVDEREMPMLSMLESIFLKIMNRMVTKDEEANKWHGRICPKIKKKLEKATEFSAGCHVRIAADDLFHVTTGEYEREYNVDLKSKSCDCKRWQLSGIPCHHAIACCRTMRKDPEQLVHSCYSFETYKAAYAYKLVPLRSRVHWEKQNGVQVHPPLYTKVMGRPKKNRKKAPEEKVKNGTKHLTRGGLTMHCSICGKPDHNKRGHYKYLQHEEEIAEHEEQVAEDIPSILQTIIPQNPNPIMDPTNQRNMMVYKMGQEAHVVPRKSHGPLPSESSFVAAARDSIPQARVTTAMARGIGGLSARGRKNNRTETQSRVRGRGKGTRRTAEASSSHTTKVSARGRGRTRRATYNTGNNTTIHSHCNTSTTSQRYKHLLSRTGLEQTTHTHYIC
uniref:Uncharacterized protein n=1 Tax=Avena sativa TaxID=4498 RepID=A0ACD5VHE1_AVESA